MQMPNYILEKPVGDAEKGRKKANSFSPGPEFVSEKKTEANNVVAAAKPKDPPQEREKPEEAKETKGKKGKKKEGGDKKQQQQAEQVPVHVGRCGAKRRREM